jgi:hypothetical protein
VAWQGAGNVLSASAVQGLEPSKWPLESVLLDVLWWRAREGAKVVRGGLASYTTPIQDGDLALGIAARGCTLVG